MKKCPFCDPEFEPKNRWRILDITNDEAWVMVPREPAAFGHLIVISKKRRPQHIDDIAYLDIDEDIKHFMNIMKQVVKVSRSLKKLSHEGKKVEKIYVLSLCEMPHLHFHLIPRFEKENTGYLFLFEKELEEKRWLMDNDCEKVQLQGSKRMGEAQGILDHHRILMKRDRWVRKEKERLRFIKQIKSEVDRLSKKEGPESRNQD